MTETVAGAVARVQAPAPGQSIAEIPKSCTCAWEYRPPVFRWRRIAPRKNCPWHSDYEEANSVV